jgi:hypothetical protein
VILAYKLAVIVALGFLIRYMARLIMEEPKP